MVQIVAAPFTTNRPRLLGLSYARRGKRLLDIVLACLLLCLCAPLLLVLWAVLRVGSGPGLFGHTRIGLNGRSFKCWKLRTMVPDADNRLAQLLRNCPVARAEWDTRQKLRNDPRVTPLGRWLRRLSLDELPQLWNVLRGEMSLVGPRPITAEELARYGNRQETYMAVRPGITGLWQVEARGKSDYAMRVALDTRYVQALALGQDLRLLGRTIGCVLRATGT